MTNSRELDLRDKVLSFFDGRDFGNEKFHVLLQRQIRIGGTVEKVANEKSIEYFYSRPRESQIGAFISEQSHIIESREVIENKYKEVEANYQDKAIPKPENWGGYLVKPHKIEFWQGRVSRLHDRLVFELKDNNWNLYRLSP